MLGSIHLSKCSLPDFAGSLWLRPFLSNKPSFGFLDVAADNVLGQVGPVVRVYFGARQLFEF